MPRSGEKNTQSGVYQSVCCELEIVIAAGSKFPSCPNHPQTITEWQAIDLDVILNKKSKPAA